MVGAFLIDCA